jgi:hypothetical protein
MTILSEVHLYPHGKDGYFQGAVPSALDKDAVVLISASTALGTWGVEAQAGPA